MRNKTFNYLTIAIVLIFFPAFIITTLKTGKPANFYTYIGLALLIPALLLLLVARIQLGSSFSVTAQANKLITTGLYKKFRHPIYYAGILLLIGMALFLQEPIAVIVLAVVIIMQKKRIKNEEQVLEEKFGEEYRIYKSNTWF